MCPFLVFRFCVFWIWWVIGVVGCLFFGCLVLRFWVFCCFGFGGFTSLVLSFSGKTSGSHVGLFSLQNPISNQWILDFRARQNPKSKPDAKLNSSRSRGGSIRCVLHLHSLGDLLGRLAMAFSQDVAVLAEILLRWKGYFCSKALAVCNGLCQNFSYALNVNRVRWRPYRVECTGSLPTSEVKRRRARLVLGWGTAREDLRVLPVFLLSERITSLVDSYCLNLHQMPAAKFCHFIEAVVHFSDRGKTSRSCKLFCAHSLRNKWRFGEPNAQDVATPCGVRTRDLWFIGPSL